jgi:hypothetical protein
MRKKNEKTGLGIHKMTQKNEEIELKTKKT